MNLVRITFAAVAAILLSGPVLAHGLKAGDIEIEHAWSRATAEGAPNGAIFVGLTNEGKSADRLIAASSPAAAKVELHTHIHDNGVMMMRPVNAIDLDAGSSITLAPGGMHIMLMGLVEPLKQGKTFPLTLTFEKAGTVTVDVMVQGAGSTKPE